MSDSGVRKIKKMLFLCSKMCFIVIALFLSYYMIKAIQFERKVKIYTNKIEVGMKESDILKSLGRYSRIDRALPSDGGCIRVVYNGKPFFRDDIILLFNPKTKVLMSKERARTYNFIN